MGEVENLPDQGCGSLHLLADGAQVPAANPASIDGGGGTKRVSVRMSATTTALPTSSV